MCLGCVQEGSLSQATYDAIQSFLGEWDAARSGPAHIVLEDCNIGDGALLWCRRLAVASAFPRTDVSEDDAALLDRVDWHDWHGRDELTATIAFLDYLLTIPEDKR